ncbi:hypothetical protein FA15DRAFT_550455, partial [Coprinopsis marcescibilis]
AQLWKSAKSIREQNRWFEATGWRWSPLLELPYWDPIRYTVVDAMHTLDLNVVHHHIREL